MYKFLVSILFLFVFILPVNAETSREKEERLEELRLERVEKRIFKVKTVENKIAKMDVKILKITENINVIKSEIEVLNRKEKKARQRLSDKLETFNTTAVTIARLERMPVEAMAAASSLRAAHSRKGVIEGGRKSLSSQISKNRNDIYELQEIQVKRHEKKNMAESLRHQRLSEKKRLEKLFSKQIKLLAVDDNVRAKMIKKAHKMKEKKTLNALLKNYKSTNTYLPKSRTSAKGLPVKGKIVRSYNEKNINGVRAHGITIETTSNEPVTAVKDGRIIYSDNFRDYGYIVILEHEDGSNSLYSGMGRSDKKIGDFLYAGKKIGLMPKSENPRLYLEIRKNGETINPSKYLAKSAS